MKAREFILLVLLLAGGILFTHIYTGKLDVRWELDGFPFWQLEEFEFEDRETLFPPFPYLLELQNHHGEVEIEGNDEEKINILFIKKLRRKNQEEAAAEASGLRLLIREDKNRLMISSNRDELRKKNVKTCFKIKVPSSMQVKVENSYGTVDIHNVGSTKIINPYGKIVAIGINGNLKAVNKYRDVNVAGVSSSCEIDSRYSNVFLRDVAGETTIGHSYGTLYLKNLSSSLFIKGKHSELEGFKLKGSNRIETTYKKINLAEIGPTRLITHNSLVEINRAEGELFIENSYDRVNLKDIEGSLTIKGKYLQVTGSDIRGETLDISSSYRKIELSRFSGQTRILLSHGDIILTPGQLNAPLEINGDYANIQLNWPTGKKYPLEVYNQNGEIDWMLKEKALFEAQNSTNILKAFTDEKDLPSIFISTTYGKVTIK